MLITFSGLDGAGKTTLIHGLKAAVEKKGCSVTVLTMYDDIALYSFLRSIRNRIKGVKGAGVHAEGITLSGQPQAMVDKNNSSWLVRLIYGVARSPFVRRCVYFFDLLILLAVRFHEEKIKKNVLILDRYFYDSLADVAGRGWWNWMYIKFFLFIIPIPDVPVFVDATADQAFARKAEYPIDYLKRRRIVYEKIFALVHRSVVIPNNDLNVALQALEASVNCVADGGRAK